MYTVGKIKLTQQALAIFIMGSVVSLLILLGLWKVGGARPAITVSLFVFAMACYNTYLTNCVSVGQCNELAWFLVAFYALAVSAGAYMGYKNK